MIRKTDEFILLTSDTPFKAPIYYKSATASTMDDALSLIAGGAVHGTVIRAGYQTAGRGRIKGRKWTGRPDENLCFTIIFHRDSLKGINLPLSLLMGWAVVRYLTEDLAITPFVKWPNDILACGGKICGILCESSGHFYTAGIGLNLNQTEFPSGMKFPAMSLKTILGQNFDPQKVLISLLEYAALTLEFPPEREIFEKSLCGLGKKTDVLLGNPGKQEMVTGIIRGIQEDGALVLEIPGYEDFLPVYSGEIIKSSLYSPC